MRQLRPLFFAPLLIALAACSPPDPVADADPAASTGAEMPDAAPVDTAPAPADFQAQAATATLQPTEGNDARGELRFEVADGYIHITGHSDGTVDWEKSMERESDFYAGLDKNAGITW